MRGEIARRAARRPGAVRCLVPLLLGLLAMLHGFGAAAHAAHAARAAQSAQTESKGGFCLVCGKRQECEPQQVREGRRIFLCPEACAEAWQADPEHFFRRLQAHSVLVDEKAVVLLDLMSGWMWFGLYVLVGLIFAGACGFLAVERARAPLLWFLLGLVINVVALLLLLARGKGQLVAAPEGIPAGLCKVPVTRAPARCPSCGQENHPTAEECPGCGAALTPRGEAEVRRA